MAKKVYWDKPKDIKFILDALNNNQVIISSTDTIYGFLANTTQKTWQKILDLKGALRQAKPFLILISSQNMLDKLSYFTDISQFDEKTLRFIDSCWPGPVTFICNAKKELPEFLSTKSLERRTIGLRCPKHEGLQSILPHFHGLFSTSANKSTERPPAKFNEISQDLLDLLEYVVVDSQESSITNSSTLVDLSAPDYTQAFPFKIIRQGAYSKEMLQDIYRKA